MREKPLDYMERARERTGPFASPAGAMHGRFTFSCTYPEGSDEENSRLLVISSGHVKGNPYANGWEHVSVSVIGEERCPTWGEMCAVKESFWDDDETVLQFHPKKSEYVNQHPFVLHLWKREGSNYALPPMHLVGLVPPVQKEEETADA